MSHKELYLLSVRLLTESLLSLDEHDSDYHYVTSESLKREIKDYLSIDADDGESGG